MTETLASPAAARHGRAGAGGAAPDQAVPGAAGPRGRGAVHAVENVSIALARSSVTAVVGESGSGKSTLARMLARIITPTSGDCCSTGTSNR